MARTCPLCHQHYAVERFGVRLTPLVGATVRVHIHQINDEETNWIIRSESDLALPRWYLRRRRIRRAA